MSGVLKKNRNPTGADFIDNVWNLRIYTLHICTRFPQRYKKWITDYIVQFSASAHIHAFEANSIFPQNQSMARERKQELTKALHALDQMYAQIELAYGMFEFDQSGGKTNDEILKVWLPKIEEVERTIGAVITSDRKRFKNLPE